MSKSKYSILTHSHFSINICNSVLEREYPTTFLGLNIDEQLTWKNHINKLKLKLSNSIYIINGIKNHLPHNALKDIYYTLIHSHLIYGITAWGASSQIEHLFKIQKKAIRLINRKSFVITNTINFLSHSAKFSCIVILQTLSLDHQSYLTFPSSNTIFCSHAIPLCTNYLERANSTNEANDK